MVIIMKIIVFWNVTLCSFTLKMEAAGFSETSIPISQTTWWHIPENCNKIRFVWLLWQVSYEDLHLTEKFLSFIQVIMFTEHWWLSSSLLPTDVTTMISQYLGLSAWNLCWESIIQTGTLTGLFNVQNCLKCNKILRTLHYFRYIIATQDKELQAVARRIPGTPLLYLHQKAPTLEQPSAASSRMARITSNQKLVKIFKQAGWDGNT